MVRDASDAAGDERALADVMSWAHAHSQTFWGRQWDDLYTSDKGIVRMPYGGWSGRWDRSEWTFIAFFPTVLRKVLVDHKYNPDAVLSGWKERGWLNASGDRQRYTRQVRVEKEKPHMVVIRREAIEKIAGEGAVLEDCGDGGDKVETRVETQ